MITLLLLYPLFLILLSKESWKTFTFKLNIFWSRVMRICCFYGVQKIDAYDLPSEPFIIVANHTSYLDIFLMYSALPDHKFLFLGKSEILSYPLVKTFFKQLNIPVYRGNNMKAAKSFISCKTALKAGWSLVIFPEGGIPDYDLPTMIPFKDGAFKMAKNVGVPMVPITFINNYRLFSDPESICGNAYPGLAKIQFHPMITKKEVAELSVTELSNKAFSMISSVLPR